MDDGEAAQLPASFFQEPALATAGLATASFWAGYAEGSQKTHVQVRSLNSFRQGGSNPALAVCTYPPRPRG